MSIATIRTALNELEMQGRMERRVGSGTYTLAGGTATSRQFVACKFFLAFQIDTVQLYSIYCAMNSDFPRAPFRRIPLYRQVCEAISGQYIEGCPPGMRLPSERELSQVMEVSMATIRTALSELEMQGRMERRVGSGTYTLAGGTATSRQFVACKFFLAFQIDTAQLYSIYCAMDSDFPHSPFRRIPLYRQVCEAISRQYIEGCPPGMRLPSERELSQMMEVSMATIRTALSELEIQGRVERRVGSGTYTLAGGTATSRHVAVLLEVDIASPHLSPFYPRLLQEVRQELLKLRISSRPYLGYLRLGLELGELTCRDFLEDLRRDRISGVISIHSRKHATWLSELRKRGVPLVGAKRSANYVVEVDVPAILKSAFSAMREAGCQHAAFAGLDNDYISTFEAVAKRIAPDFGLKLSFVRLPVKFTSQSLEKFRSLWAAEFPPDGLFVGDDMLLPAVEEALDSAGVPELPRECSYVYTSDAVTLSARRPITRCTYPVRTKAVLLAEAMRDLLDGREAPHMIKVPFSFAPCDGLPSFFMPPKTNPKHKTIGVS